MWWALIGLAWAESGRERFESDVFALVRALREVVRDQRDRGGPRVAVGGDERAQRYLREVHARWPLLAIDLSDAVAHDAFVAEAGEACAAWVALGDEGWTVALSEACSAPPEVGASFGRAVSPAPSGAAELVAYHDALSARAGYRVQLAHPGLAPPELLDAAKLAAVDVVVLVPGEEPPADARGGCWLSVSGGPPLEVFEVGACPPLGAESGYARRRRTTGALTASFAVQALAASAAAAGRASGQDWEEASGSLAAGFAGSALAATFASGDRGARATATWALPTAAVATALTVAGATLAGQGDDAGLGLAGVGVAAGTLVLPVMIAIGASKPARF